MENLQILYKASNDIIIINDYFLMFTILLWFCLCFLFFVYFFLDELFLYLIDIFKLEKKNIYKFVEE
jgi:hypothetical protein